MCVRRSYLLADDSSSALAAAATRGRRNSNSIGIIPEGLEIGSKRHHKGTDGSFYGTIRASMMGKFINGGDNTDSSSSVTPQAGGSPRGNMSPPKKIHHTKTSMQIMSEEMDQTRQNGSGFGPVTKEVRKSVIDHFKHDLDNFRKQKRSCIGIPIMHPASPNRMKWDILLSIVLVWNLIEIPFQVCFDVEPDCMSAYDFFALTLDIFFICDVICNFHTGFIDEGKYIDDVKTVRHHYIWHGFFLDFITSVPYGRLLNLFAGGFCSPNADEESAR